MVDDVAEIGRNWWLFVVLGLICLLTGVLAIVWPGKTLLVVGILAGVYLLVTAILEIIDAIIGEPGGRALSAILGVISLIAGLVFLRRPGESLLAILLVVGIWFVVTGLIDFIRAFANVEYRALRLLTALVDIVLGGFILALPHLSLGTLAVLIGLAFVVRGVISIVRGFQLRKAVPA